MVELPKKPTETPNPPSPEGDRSALKSDKEQNDRLSIIHGKERVKKMTKDSLKNLKKGVYSVTLDARAGVDRAPLKHVKWLRKAEGKIKEIETKFLVEIENLIPGKPLTPEEYQVLINKIDEIVQRHKKEVNYYWHALVYAVKAFTGVSGAIKTEDYAMFDSLLENINELYSKDVKIGELIKRIQLGTPLDDKEWDTICSYIEKYPYVKEVSSSQDRINLSITALFVQMMDSNQRYDLVLKFHERNNRDIAKTSKLIKTFTETNVINIAQMRKLMTAIQGSEYQMSQDEEKEIQQRQEATLRITREVRKTMQSPLVINSAERILNPKSMAACAVIALGGLGMAMNYLSRFNKGKGAGRYLAGLASPYFIISAAVTAGGVHALGSGMRPGEVPGFFDKMFPRPKRMENPFGLAKNAEAQDASFTDLVSLCTSYKAIEQFLFDTDGFKDVMAFYASKKVDVQRMREEAKIREVTKPKTGPRKTDVFEEFLQFIEKDNPKGKALLEQIDKGYGRQTARLILLRLFVSVHKVGVQSSRSFKDDKVPNQQFTYYELYKHRSGLEPLKIPVAAPAGQPTGQTYTQTSTSPK